MSNVPGLFLPVGAVLFCACGECARITEHGQPPAGWTVDLNPTGHSLISALRPRCPECNLQEYPYVWNWGAVPYMSETMQSRKGQPCRVLVRGRMNSCLLEFQDGYRVVTSRNGIRRR